MREKEPPPPKGLPGEMVMVAAVALTTVLTMVAFPRRADCAGHFLGGAGATALLLMLVCATLQKPKPYAVLAVCVAAIGMGAITEATIFRLAAYDWVDFAIQSMGAVLVTAPFVGGGGSRQASVQVGLASFAMLIGAVVLVSV